MNCIKNGKLTNDSCFGCDIKTCECEIIDLIQWKYLKNEKPTSYRRLIIVDSDDMILIARFMNNSFFNIEHDEFNEKQGWNGRIIENVVKWKYI